LRLYINISPSREKRISRITIILSSRGSLNKHKGTLSKPTEGTNTILEGISNIPSPNTRTTSNLYSIYSIVRGVSTLRLQVYSTIYSAIHEGRAILVKSYYKHIPGQKAGYNYVNHKDLYGAIPECCGGGFWYIIHILLAKRKIF
jgi:hypothetical protein